MVLQRCSVAFLVALVALMKGAQAQRLILHESDAKEAPKTAVRGASKRYVLLVENLVSAG